MASVRLNNVSKSFGDTKVVKGADLDIEDGDFVVLVGPSGCGKSTVLRMIAGLESVSAGEILIGERAVKDVDPRDRDVAMVFQSYALYPHMTVRDNISFGLRLRKIESTEIAKRVEDAANILGLDGLLERKPKQLSGGQRQRVAMGRAIVRQPSVFLFDEPLSNLDAKLRVQMRAEIAKLHQRLGTTTIYVTHDQVEAMTLAKHIVVMNDGIIQQVGAPLELYREPANIFVAGFIGSPAMNFLEVEITASEGQKRITSDAFSIPLPARFDLEVGSALVLGLRPEHTFESDDLHDTIPTKIDVLEPLGANVFALGTVGKTFFNARLGPDTNAQVGDTVQLGVDLDGINLFHRDTERRVESGETRDAA
ncbi:MAG: sn-glycerol-3-phosphate ABC transporter ATP-binding protein UgpC [Myxococcota bacterium]